MTSEFYPLNLSNIAALVRLHSDESPDYSRYFSPFPFNAETFEEVLKTRAQDLYFVILSDGNEAGFYMLRGFDAGYARPAYGVWIAEKYCRRGLGDASLTHAIATCTALHCSEIMLKVHPDNLHALRLYERFGFVPSGFDNGNHNLIYRLPLSSHRTAEAVETAEGK